MPPAPEKRDKATRFIFLLSARIYAVMNISTSFAALSAPNLEILASHVDIVQESLRKTLAQDPRFGE